VRVPADRVTVPVGRLSVPANANDDATDSVDTLWKLFDGHHLRQYRPMNWTYTVCSECCGSANFQNSTVRTHYPALINLYWQRVTERIYFKLAFMMYQSMHVTSPSYLQSCFTQCFRHDIQTTAAVFYLSSFESSARSSLCSRQAGVSGFWCHRLERPASSHRICAVTRGFQTTTRDFSVFLFLPRWLMCYYYCLDNII